MMNFWNRIRDKISILIGKIDWAPKNLLTEDEKQHIREMLISDYYIILTRNNNHLATYAISLANLFLTGKWSYWGHILMNLEDSIKDDADFRLIEAIGPGVRISTFDSVFDTNSVAFLRPKNMSIEHWTAVLDRAKCYLGRPYDTLFDLKSDTSLSCVELVRNALKGEPNYETDFANFEALIKKSKNLTPQMFYDCEDFVVVHEIRRR